jgi:hypothetical protein
MAQRSVDNGILVRNGDKREKRTEKGATDGLTAFQMENLMAKGTAPCQK